MLYVSKTDVANCFGMPLQSFHKALTLTGDIDAPNAKIDSPRSKWPEKGYRIEEAVIWLRKTSPFFTPEIESQLRALARVSKRAMAR